MCHEKPQNGEADCATGGTILIAPANGLGPMGWGGPVCVQVAAECGRAFPPKKGPVLPAPLVDGGWMNRSVTSKRSFRLG